jgi:PPK2 family polyphosphate:nucleotide phosphotransferase
MSGINPSGCHVWSFKAPTEEERSHDFLWRIHQHTPGLGTIAIFNRSHYEDVLIARVHNLVPPKVWKKRYQQINDFEQMLAENGTLIFKFFLHISKDEQEKRLCAREADPTKAWKIAAADWQERAYWDDYVEAYEEALGACSASWAPWHVIPANKKWCRNYLVAQTLIDGLEPHARQWRKALKERGERNLSELRAYHEQEQHAGD